MKLFAMGALLLATVLPVMADEPAEQPADAPAAVIQEAKATCLKWAEEDGVAKEELDSYLLQCVNDQLADLGYKPVTKIDG